MHKFICVGPNIFSFFGIKAMGDGLRRKGGADSNDSNGFLVPISSCCADLLVRIEFELDNSPENADLDVEYESN